MLGYSTRLILRMYISHSIVEIIIILGVLLPTISAKGVSAIIAEKSGGFSVSRLPTFNLFSLQCNGSHLPSDTRAILYMGLERRTDSKSETFASITADGVRLEKSLAGTRTYVNGVFDSDSFQNTHLTVLMNDVIPQDGGDVTYVCSIMHSNRGGQPFTVKRKLHISAADIQNMYHLKQAGTQTPLEIDETQTPLETDETQTGHVTPSKQTQNGDPFFNTPMILLIVMAGLLFILFIVCFLLVVSRCKDNRRQRLRAERVYKRQSTRSEEFQTPTGLDSRPLPVPPTSSYPPGTAVTPYKSHRIKYGSGVKAYTDDTGYDSDASTLYARTYDDVGKIAADKAALKTFEKHKLTPLDS